MNCERAVQYGKTVPDIRVCVFCETWESGGIESFLCNVLKEMDLSRLKVDIVASSIKESVFTKLLQECGVRFLELSGNQRKVAENHRRFRELVRERCYDELHLNAFHGLSLAYLNIARQEGIPVRIAHSHNTALRKSPARPLKLMLHSLAKKQYTKYATELWACSHAAAEFLFDKRDLKRGFKFIPNGIDVDRFRFNTVVRDEVRKGLGLDNQFVIGNVGRLCFQKNQTFLLDVFSEVLKRHPDSRLLLVGNGEDKPALLEKAQRLGVSEKVLFCGTTQQVERLLWAMDVFAFPSQFEGLGIAAIEAQAAGLQVICSENIPKETCITTHIYVVPLTRESDTWAEACLRATGHFLSGADEVKAAGYDVRQVSELIGTCYQQMCRKQSHPVSIKAN